MSKVIPQFESLDFSGGSSSWFDLWHTHSDWTGECQESNEKRIASIEKLIALYEQFCERLKHYPKSYQLWIEIWEDDSSEDAIYIHSPNPNSDNFPILLEPADTLEVKDEELRIFLKHLPFATVGMRGFDENVFYLYKDGIGVGLVP